MKKTVCQHADKIDGLMAALDTYLSTYYYLCGFTLLGFITFLISLIMLLLESRLALFL
ncbi:hypothetical protein [Rubritalea sp.]|uniref:hypothetical protein n=1 Tax=Rubritalea sp. TaxID=2109375 RepID=UPI003241E29A